MDPNVLHNLSYGMYVVSSNKGSLPNAQIVNTVFQITSDPVRIGISINNKNLTYEYIESSSRFSVSIIDEGAPLSFIGKFGFHSGRERDKFKDTNFITLHSGCPVVVDNALCYLEARIIKKLDCFTHTLYIGEMTGSKMLKPGKPMTYDYYHQVKHGTTPSSAPTFLKEEMPDLRNRETKEVSMQRYRCTVCNYIYDPAVGDPDGGIVPGTAFENIPDTWVCPVCGADKSQFVKD